MTIAAILVGLALLAALAQALVLRGPWILFRPAAIETQAASAQRLEADVRFMSIDCHPRNYQHHENRRRVTDMVAARFSEAGLEVSFQDFELREGRFRNVLGRRKGTDPTASGTVIIGAHHDSCFSTPGADDNASAVAALLEMLRLTAGNEYRRDQLFVSFANEEPPFFGGKDMGSHRLAEKLVADGEAVHFMLALDMLGYYSDEKGSQPSPFPGMKWLYGDRGDFIAVAGDLGSGPGLKLVKRAFLASESLPIRSLRSPRELGWVNLSDHSSFWENGLPGVMLTDTGPLRNRNYHGPGDTADTLDYEKLARVVRGLQAVLVVADED
ncbi:MAG: M28 family peptidase [Acidobacteriota bacterium]